MHVRDFARAISNPFVAAAGVSRQLREVESRHPMYAQGLQRLRNRVNSFVMKVEYDYVDWLANT